jgi:hypothetical protein
LTRTKTKKPEINDQLIDTGFDANTAVDDFTVAVDPSAANVGDALTQFEPEHVEIGTLGTVAVNVGGRTKTSPIGREQFAARKLTRALSASLFESFRAGTSHGVGLTFHPRR